MSTLLGFCGKQENVQDLFLFSDKLQFTNLNKRCTFAFPFCFLCESNIMMSLGSKDRKWDAYSCCSKIGMFSCYSITIFSLLSYGGIFILNKQFY